MASRSYTKPAAGITGSASTVRGPLAFLASFAILGLLPAPAPAVTLAEAVDAALAVVPGGELHEARRHEGDAIRRQAGSLFAKDPVITLDHYNDGIGSGDGAREWEAAVRAPIWLPGQRAARRALAEAALDQAEALMQSRRWQVAGEVRERLWAVVIARARVEHEERALADARRLEEAVERRVAAGESPRSELLLARRETLLQETALLAARSARDTAEADWRYYTGLAGIPSDYRETEATGRNVDETHPGLALHIAAAERAAAAREQARSDRRDNPVVSLGARRERDDRGDPWNDAIALGIEVPIGLPSQSAPAIAAAEYAMTEAQVARLEALRTLEEEVRRAEAQLKHTRAALATVRRAGEIAAESLRLAQVAFDVGEEDLFKLLEVRKRALEAEWAVRRLELAEGQDLARYNQALGVVPQ
jgi:outer membrane protein TolC